MEEQQLITHLAKSVYHADPRPEWFAATRKELLLRVNGEPHAVDSVGFFRHWGQLPELLAASLRSAFAQLAQHRLLAGGAFAMLFTLLGGVSFAVSRNALPSSTLYPLKLAAESAAGSLAFTEKSQADHTLDLAENRFRELSQLSRTAGARNASNAQSELIANTARRYAAALSTSTETLKRLQAEGNTVLAVHTAEKLEKTANAYSTLLSLLDTASSSSPLSIFDNAKEVSEEAQRAAQEVLQTHKADESVASATPDASPMPTEVTASASPSLAKPQASDVPPGIPSVMPNVF